jgi:hypothetical protein
MPVIIRYTPPTRYDIAEYGARCKVMESEKPIDLYVQISKDEQSPNWKRMGDFLELAFAKEIHEDDFINQCLAKI